MSITPLHGPSASRDRYIAQLALATAGLGMTVPEDPGAGELADLLDQAAAPLLAEADDRSDAGHRLAKAAESLRSAALTSGLMPVVANWHLRTAVLRLEAAHELLDPESAPH